MDEEGEERFCVLSVSEGSEAIVNKVGVGMRGGGGGGGQDMRRKLMILFRQGVFLLVQR